MLVPSKTSQALASWVDEVLPRGSVAYSNTMALEAIKITQDAGTCYPYTEQPGDVANVCRILATLHITILLVLLYGGRPRVNKYMKKLKLRFQRKREFGEETQLNLGHKVRNTPVKKRGQHSSKSEEMEGMRESEH